MSHGFLILALSSSGGLYAIFLPWFPFLQTGGGILQQGLLLDSYTIFK